MSRTVSAVSVTRRATTARPAATEGPPVSRSGAMANAARRATPQRRIRCRALLLPAVTHGRSFTTIAAAAMLAALTLLLLGAPSARAATNANISFSADPTEDLPVTVTVTGSNDTAGRYLYVWVTPNP